MRRRVGRQADWVWREKGKKLFLALCFIAHARADGPVGGIPFTLSQDLSPLPSQESDGKDAVMSIYRRGGVVDSEANKWHSPHECDLGDQADPKACLGKDRGCMWTTVTSRDPLKRVQDVNSYCLPCELDKNPIPCWNIGAWVGGRQVTDCKMSCNHHETILQPQYACIDDSGFISQSQCFDRAARSGSKCMYMEYKDPKGKNRASCAPCELEGSGTWTCPKIGGEFPIQGAKLKSCINQCDVICAGRLIARPQWRHRLHHHHSSLQACLTAQRRQIRCLMHLFLSSQHPQSTPRAS